MKLHIIFALKYNKQQLLLLLDKINDYTSKILGAHYHGRPTFINIWGDMFPLSHRDRRPCHIGPYGECRARAYNWGMGAVPQRGPGGQGAKPPEAALFTARRYAKRGRCRRRVSVSVCVCVCVSITLRYCIKTAEHRITQIMTHDSPMTLVF